MEEKEEEQEEESGKNCNSVAIIAEEVLRLRGKMILLINLLLLTGCGCAGESEFYTCDVAKGERKRAKVGKATAIRKYLMWSPCAHESIFFMT